MQITTKHQFAAPDDGAGVEKITFELRRILSKTVNIKSSVAFHGGLLLFFGIVSFVTTLFLYPLKVN